MNATAKLLFESALQVYECEAPDCKAVAIRGDFCVEHGRACSDCREFHAVGDIKDGLCPRCLESACEYDLEEYVSAECYCGSRKPSHVARKAVK